VLNKLSADDTLSVAIEQDLEKIMSLLNRLMTQSGNIIDSNMNDISDEVEALSSILTEIEDSSVFQDWA